MENNIILFEREPHLRGCADSDLVPMYSCSRTAQR